VLFKSVLVEVVYLDYVEITGVYSVVGEFYKQVSQESMRHRFLHLVSDISYVYKYLWSRGCQTFLVYKDNKSVGIVDVTPCGDGVEVAIVIADRHQGRGIGTAVAFDFADRLRRMGFRYAFAYVSPDNYRVLAVAKRLGAQVKCRDLCVVKYEFYRGAAEACA